MNGQLMASGNPSQRPYQTYRDHSAGVNNNTEALVLEAVRSAHVESQVTSFAEREFDILGWAKDGHANVLLDRKDNIFHARRTYEAAEDRIDDSSGKLGENVQFGLYNMIWEGMALQFYVVEWPLGIFGNTQRVFFLLTDKSAAADEGYDPLTNRLLQKIGDWTARLHNEIWLFDQGDWVKDKRLWKGIKKSSWNDVVLQPAMKDELYQDVSTFFDNRGDYRRYGVPWKRGIIFHGSPGCGKTMSIKALVNLLDQRADSIPSLVVKSFNSCEGLQSSIKQVFGLARDMAPCLLILEDLDSLVVDKVRSYFLNEVDGLEDNDGILILGSTNHLDRLDVGISKRPSRFDRKYHFQLPDRPERVKYLEYWRAKLAAENSDAELGSDVCEAVADNTEGFSFAYLKELIVQTLLTLARHSSTTLGNGSNAHDEVEDGSGQSNGQQEAGNSVENLPKHLQTNALMRSFLRHIQSLRRDMNSGDRKLDPVSNEGDNEE